MKPSLFLLLLFLSIGFVGQSQDSISKKEINKLKKDFLLRDRPWTIEIPLWIPGFAGEFSYGEVSLEGEDGGDPGDPGDPDDDDDPGFIERVFSSEWYLKFFYLSRFNYEKGRFIAQLDGIAGSVGNSVKFNYNNKEIVQANFRTVNVRLFAGFKILEANSKSKNFRYKLFAYLGTRAHYQKISSDLNNIINKIDINPHWFEPIIGIQNQFVLKRWMFVLQGDYGGLFLNDKWSDQITINCYYRSGKFTSIKLGWNFLQLNHTGTIQSEDYTIKVNFSGPSAGLAFHF